MKFSIKVISNKLINGHYFSPTYEIWLEKYKKDPVKIKETNDMKEIGNIIQKHYLNEQASIDRWI